jgi:hypothetical protein
VRQVRVEREAFATVTTHTAESFNGMRGADLGQVRVTGETVFGLTCESWNQFNRLGLARIQPPDEDESEKKEEGGEREKAAHGRKRMKDER